MSDCQLSGTERNRTQANDPFATPELSEAVWLAWQEKNRSKDRIRSAHRRRVFMVLFASAAAALAAAYSAGLVA